MNADRYIILPAERGISPYELVDPGGDPIVAPIYNPDTDRQVVNPVVNPYKPEIEEIEDFELADPGTDPDGDPIGAPGYKKPQILPREKPEESKVNASGFKLNVWHILAAVAVLFLIIKILK